MALESSEVQDFSWRISTILVSFLVFSSSSCHALPPLLVRPIMTIQEMVLRIIFYSPEFNRVHHFLEVDFHDEEDESISSILLQSEKEYYPWFNIGPSSFPNRYSSCGGTWQNLLFVVLLWPLIGLQNHLHSILTAYSSNCTSEVSCSLLFKFVTNLFKPWEILAHEWELSLFIDINILISQLHIYLAGNRL